ncbi:uncharacterized protein SAMN04487881_0027 [Marinobacter sp. es.048]|uniref:TM0106 family RecB-like putative nuclease n=1 Tax=Marinobacter sp. es.048 TaxID=1761795 RepID=UPI000B5880E8|nr:TM0106 family RecB-like putative nuclease [Marinobacter sp. es.048]SNC59292.1 uncharacterized protein SAMN04487881_0027 [Marinobacter sp. es.048]
MKFDNNVWYLTASDLVAHSSCDHLMMLEKQVALGDLKKTEHYDPLLELLRERGDRHENAYLNHLVGQGQTVTTIKGSEVTDESVRQTLDAMYAGDPVIAQAALRDGRWRGRADALLRVEKNSALGEWSYEVVDTKLARETKGGTIIQLCLYADLLSKVQKRAPEFVYVVAPWQEYVPQRFRYADYSAYFRRVKSAAESDAAAEQLKETYPDPKAHCDVCRWQNVCEKRRRDDDHLCLVANISKGQIKELKENRIHTLEDLAKAPSPLPGNIASGSRPALEKVKAQAEIQARSRESGKLHYELLGLIPDAGLSALPEPSDGDVFFDIESDQFAAESGLEYLFGYVYRDDNGELTYQHEWAFRPSEEKAMFERFVDFVTERRKRYPAMHVYHFAPYEPSALKRLMGRFATRENQIDNFLRQGVFVDLLAVVRQGVRASVESYSLKKLEPFFDFRRKVPLREANAALTRLTYHIELDHPGAIDSETKSVVQQYNADDCFSTAALRDWLETLREELEAQGCLVARPDSQSDETAEDNEQAAAIRALMEKLTADVPDDVANRTEEQHGRWILANLLEWHRREEKSEWWEYFRLCELQPDELFDEKAAVSGLDFIHTVKRSKTGIPVDQYRFNPQETEVREGDELRQAGGEKLGNVAAVSVEDGTIDIKKRKDTADTHPEAVFAHRVISANEQKAAIQRLAEYVATHGISGNGKFQAARNLLLRSKVAEAGESLLREGERTLDAALRIAPQLSGEVLAIQGPPGTGKSYSGAQVICDLVARGKKVGITANSHKVIRNLIDAALKQAARNNQTLECFQKPGADHNEANQPGLTFVRSNGDLLGALDDGTAQVAGATHFLWSREDALSSLDVLVVDEAAQMSLANVVAIAGAADSVILLGDPRQLEQPTKGAHPEGADCSALDHLLGGNLTISADQGLFLGETYRLHPAICAFNSELFYESKLVSVPGTEKQRISSAGDFSGSGLQYCPVEHKGNTSRSVEEATVVEQMVREILADNPSWVDREGVEKPLTMSDILIIAPYNAQVFELHKKLPDARIGTVDKFQGQEAPIAIFSMATSSHSDAPRGMEFLYSASRLNVAISRAKCLAILVASPEIFEAECRTPGQMALANAFCRYLEQADVVRASGLMQSCSD